MACQGTRGAKVPPIILLERKGVTLDAETHTTILMNAICNVDLLFTTFAPSLESNVCQVATFEQGVTAALLIFVFLLEQRAALR